MSRGIETSVFLHIVNLLSLKIVAGAWKSLFFLPSDQDWIAEYIMSTYFKIFPTQTSMKYDGSETPGIIWRLYLKFVSFIALVRKSRYKCFSDLVRIMQNLHSRRDQWPELLTYQLEVECICMHMYTWFQPQICSVVRIKSVPHYLLECHLLANKMIIRILMMA